MRGSLGPVEVFDLSAKLASVPRPLKPPVLFPRQPRRQLGWTMQKLRLLSGWTLQQTAGEFRCTAGHLSRVEHGSMPSRDLANFYDDTFGGEGLIHSLLEVAISAHEQARRRAHSHPTPSHAVHGDASTFEGDTIPHGTLMQPGELFAKDWLIRNSGTTPWTGRMLERQGPLTGPGLITSLRYYPIRDTKPGETVKISSVLKAPTYDCASIAYFKMVDPGGALCFPDKYQLGLDVLVLVRGQMPDKPIDVEA